MNMLFKHLISVPARVSTVDAALMERLAKEAVSFSGGKTFRIIAMPEGKEPSVSATAELLGKAISKIGGQVQAEERVIVTKYDHDNSSDEKVKAILKIALANQQESDVLILVMELEFAQKVPRVFIWDVLGNHRIIKEVDQVFQPGQAGIVSCENANRNTIPNPFGGSGQRD
ncbi:MAG: hypothetical protein NTY04_03260 [Candidatus Staskawiczbacteria bacterium]|nr:hypothetical protein [Candidatus Staskawiczbacteria bacterium]